jgi:hypothetical protein
LNVAEKQMKRIPMLRLATYLVFIAILLSARNQIRVIPVALTDPEFGAAMMEAESRLRVRMDEMQRITQSHGFFAAKRSGAEVFSISSRVAQDYGADLSGFLRPEVKLKLTGERLKWVLMYVRDYGEHPTFPSETFSITIDDETGVASSKNETARY